MSLVLSPSLVGYCFLNYDAQMVRKDAQQVINLNRKCASVGGRQRRESRESYEAREETGGALWSVVRGECSSRADNYTSSRQANG